MRQAAKKAPVNSKVVPLREGGSSAAIHLGVVVRWNEEGCFVDFADNRDGPVKARVASSLVRGQPAAGLVGREVVLLVDPSGRRPPTVLGMLEPLSSAPAAETPELRLDGKRVELEAYDELVLTCGQASITLRRNGRVVVRGTHVETCSDGVNRITGAVVRIN